jgi:hypothetical protein
MRRGSKRIAANSDKRRKSLAKPPKLPMVQVARIRERREQVYRREGLLSESAALIREDRECCQ